MKNRVHPMASLYAKCPKIWTNAPILWRVWDYMDAKKNARRPISESVWVKY